MFQITVALLQKDYPGDLGDISNRTPSHERVIRLFVDNYCNKKKVFPAYKSFLNHVMIQRQKADYTVDKINEKKAKRVFEKAMNFVTSLQKKYEEQ